MFIFANILTDQLTTYTVSFYGNIIWRINKQVIKKPTNKPHTKIVITLNINAFFVSATGSEFIPCHADVL